MRNQLQQQGLPVDNAPADEEVRETYNFPPGAFGLVYRADVPDGGVQEDDTTTAGQDEESNEQSKSNTFSYELKAMKWGLIPFWTKRSPDYGSMMRTINCRDDSLIDNRGMWTTMKLKKRCIVVAQGFYEWLKKGPGGKEKMPHFVKRKDGNLICFAGLWDCVQYENTEEKLYTYTIITTSSNKQLNFLHDRMPVVLEPNSESFKMWLDPTRTKWSDELQSILKPYEGELDCYPVSKDVGKVGNNSPDFIIPIDSKENKNNIANFFGKSQKSESNQIEEEKTEKRATVDHDSTENHAPLPVPTGGSDVQKRKREDEDQRPAKTPKIEDSPKDTSTPTKMSGRKTRSATSNQGRTLKRTPEKNAADGSQRITNFFGS